MAAGWSGGWKSSAWSRPTCPHRPQRAVSLAAGNTGTHVRQLFGDRVESLQVSERTYTERAPSPQK
jgi:hypothetical protein